MTTQLQTRRTKQDARVFNMFGARILVIKNPILPLAGPVLHASEDDLGDFQTGLSETN